VNSLLAEPGFSRSFILFDNASANHGLLFHSPERVLMAREGAAIPALLRELDEALCSGYWAAGFLSYELGLWLEPKLAASGDGRLLDSLLPLAWIGVFRAPRKLSDRELDRELADGVTGGHRLSRPEPLLTREQYVRQIDEIQSLIRRGDIYQANFSFPCQASLWGTTGSLYASLRTRQRSAHGGWLSAPEFSILSLSPELLVKSDGITLVTRPMKGTAPRCEDPEVDARAAAALQADCKSQAENLMIVDLLRNDLSRLCAPGTVRVPSLFALETYPTFHALTSTIEGRLAGNPGMSALLEALFPCGSVTGAPKIRAMEVIRSLESGPRGPYCGSLCWFAPDRRFALNVAIRTLVVEELELARDSRPVHFSLGSGIVADSDPQLEWDECLLKGRFIELEAVPFQLLETLRWEPGTGFRLLESHLARLEASASWWAFHFDRERVITALHVAATSEAAHLQQALRVRLRLSADGTPHISATPLPELGLEPLRLTLSSTRVESTDLWLRHKTTRRVLYDQVLQELRSTGTADESLFLNQRGEITEGTISNLFVETQGKLLTPPLACGVLPGVCRQQVLRNDSRAEEAILTLQDLVSAEAIWLSNAVRGLVRASAVDSLQQEIDRLRG